jgi:acyl-CoA thioesterase FadM
MNEIRVGEHIAVHTGLVEVDSKRIHFIHYIVNLTHMRVSSSDERVAMYMNMSERRGASWEPEIREKLEQARSFYKSLAWEPELSGAIQLKRE